METDKRNRPERFLFLAVLFAAATLRAPITAVGPLISSMKADLPFSSGVLGLLTTIPLIMFAVVSPFVRRLSDAFGAGNTLAGGTALILLGVAVRSYAGVAGILIGTLLLGAGVAIGNVLIPAVIKARFPQRLGFGTSAFTVSMTLLAALASAVSYPLSAIDGVGWRNSLAVWMLPALLALSVWWPHHTLKIRQTKAAPADASEAPERPVYCSPMAWWLTLLMGAQSLLFYFFTAWLPTIAQFKGFSPETAGYIAFAYQLSTLPAALIIPGVAAKRKDQRGVITLVSSLYLLSLAALVCARSTALFTLAVVGYGFSTGSCFNLCMLLIGLRTRSAERAASLSGMMQSFGYALGAFGPILGGWLFDRTGSWNAAFLCVAVMILLIFVSGQKAGRNRYI